MKLLVLHSRLSGYFIACLARLFKVNVTIKIVAAPSHSDAPFGTKTSRLVGEVVNRNDFSDSDLLSMALEFEPDVVLVVGWLDMGYNKVCRVLKKHGILIVAGCDTQWKGSLRQRVASLVASLHTNKFIDVLWVSGERQRQLAYKLGYRGNFCWDGYYACDWELFSPIAESRFSSLSGISNSTQKTKAFCYVGRYVPEKGLDTLVSAYQLYSQKVKHPWKLICAGKGEHGEQLISVGAEDNGFIQPQELPKFFAQATAFILPSRFEPWGVVVQEAAATGLPLIISDACGAGVHLLRDRWNGRSFVNQDPQQLAECMLWMHNQPNSCLLELGINSFELSKQYTPERWARTFVEGFKSLLFEPNRNVPCSEQSMQQIGF